MAMPALGAHQLRRAHSDCGRPRDARSSASDTSLGRAGSHSHPLLGRASTQADRLVHRHSSDSLDGDRRAHHLHDDQGQASRHRDPLAWSNYHRRDREAGPWHGGDWLRPQGAPDRGHLGRFPAPRRASAGGQTRPRGGRGDRLCCLKCPRRAAGIQGRSVNGIGGASNDRPGRRKRAYPCAKNFRALRRT